MTKFLCKFTSAKGSVYGLWKIKKRIDYWRLSRTSIKYWSRYEIGVSWSLVIPWFKTVNVCTYIVRMRQIKIPITFSDEIDKFVRYLDGRPKSKRSRQGIAFTEN
ncbi:hypothetical protein WN51_07414 [Melipona quadrifasciata]|uniref:Uncharacterized protein n=1 Tax=Melipona quadrifasciata TaxID=166423 RepID=A0A0N0U326_9HYME|nr:hypothetical protein WN51_07414 [Melipona quadrifasciata]